MENYKNLLELVDNFMKEMGWEYFERQKVLKKVSEEFEELNKELEAKNEENAELEFGDYIFALCCWVNGHELDAETFDRNISTTLLIIRARGFDFDPETALLKSIAKFRVRDKNRYPEGK